MFDGVAGTPSSGEIASFTPSRQPDVESLTFTVTSTAGGEFVGTIGIIRGPVVAGQLAPQAGASTGATITFADAAGNTFTFTGPAASAVQDMASPTGGLFPMIFNGVVTLTISGLGNAKDLKVRLYSPPRRRGRAV